MAAPITSRQIRERSGKYAEFCRKLADDIWDHPEIAFGETFASRLQADFLAANGFKITFNVGGIPTAFMAEAGEAGPLIAFLGEYDALPVLSQDAGTVTQTTTSVPRGNGHGCGHNLLGSASILASLITRDIIAESAIPGRVRYYGCPAEEHGSGKTYMLRGGAFAGLDAALSWHPLDVNFAFFGSWMANIQADFRFHGRSAHAAFGPAMGRSALDAVELMNVGVNFLREHMESDCRVHYAITDAGGRAANIVQAFAEVTYTIRAPNNAAASELFTRVKKIAEGAALMTETTMEMELHTATSSILPNRVLSEVMHRHLVDFGAPPFDENDFTYAQAIQKTLEPRELRTSIASRSGLGGGRALFSEILPLSQNEILLPVSGDIGDVELDHADRAVHDCLLRCRLASS